MFLAYLFNNVTLLILFYWYNKKLFLQEGERKYGILLILSLVILRSLFNLYNSFQINLVLTIFTYLGISSIFFKGTIIKKTVFIGFFIITSFISEISVYIFLTPFLKQYTIQSNSLLYTFIGIALSGIILFLIVFVITKVNDINDMIDSKGLWYFIAFPIISVMIIYSIMHSNLLEINYMSSILISFGIVIFNIIICIGFADIIKSKNIQIENEKLKSQKLHHLLLEEKIDQTKQFVHDFKKHVNILNGYVSSREYGKLESYLKEIDIVIKNEDTFVITGNQLIDLSVHANKSILIEHSIAIKYDVKIKNLDSISELDFNIVFSNIFDNAIESCIRTDGHFIKIKLNKTNKLIILKIINPCLGVNTNYETLKSDKEYHGYGIKTIKKIVKKYNGSAVFTYDEENSIFVSTIILESNT